MRAFLIALGVGVAGIIVCCLVVYAAATSWDTFSDDWLMLPTVLPCLGVVFGYWLATKVPGSTDHWPVTEGKKRFGYATLAAGLSSLSGYLGFVVLIRAWSDGPPALGFLSQVFAPSSLAELSQESSTGAASSVGYGMPVFVGAFAGFWIGYQLVAQRL